MLNDEPKVVEPANGAEQIAIMLQPNGTSNNSEHSERRENSADENRPEVPKKKMYTFKAWAVYLSGVIFFFSLFANIVLGIFWKHLSRNPSCVIPCLQGWVVHKDWCYYFSIDEATWNSSQSNCSSYGGSLTAIDSPNEMTFLHSEKKATDYWFGLRRETGQPWKWANGSDFDPWFPIGADGECAYLNDGNASSSWCTTERRWICRRPSD